MTKIKHVITSIQKCEREDNCILAIFSELVNPEHMSQYLDSAKQAWTRDNMPGIIPDNILDTIRKERFRDNKFTMHFPFYEWKNRNLMLNQQVEIDMPLQLSDVTLCEQEIGI